MIFRNTTIYKESLTIINTLKNSNFNKSKSIFHDILITEIWKSALNLNTSIAESLQFKSSNEIYSHLKFASHALSTFENYLFHLHTEKIIHENNFLKLNSIISNLKSDLNNFPNRKKILILSSIMGQGHMSAAKATKEGIETMFGLDYNVEIIDFIEKIGKLFNKATKKIYENSTKYTPYFYKLFFESTDARWQVKLLNLLNYPLNASKLETMFEQYNPKLIISTFPVWDYLVNLVWKNKHPDCPFISIVTDSISIHNAWVTGKLDYHIVANHDTQKSLISLGADPKKIKILGFPVRMEFQKPSTTREEFLKSLNLNPKLFTILFIPSSEKTKKAKSIIQNIENKLENTNLIIITGRDNELTPKLKGAITKTTTKLIGWTDKMPLFMLHSDLIISKAGGATVMECIAAKKPMIITQVIPGQEIGNAELIKRYNLGIVNQSNPESILKDISFIKEYYTEFKNNLHQFSTPNSALNIAKFIQTLL